MKLTTKKIKYITEIEIGKYLLTVEMGNGKADAMFIVTHPLRPESYQRIRAGGCVWGYEHRMDDDNGVLFSTVGIYQRPGNSTDEWLAIVKWDRVIDVLSQDTHS